MKHGTNHKKQSQVLPHAKSRSSRSQLKPKNHPLRLLGTIALVCSLSGAALGFLMAATPLQGLHASQGHLARASERVRFDQPLNILILGIDNSGHPHRGNVTPKEALAGNSDTMLLVRLNPFHQMTILSIPRDTLVEMSDGVDKINAANVKGGVKLAAQTVSHLLKDVPIDRYLRIDTESFTQLVDALGGVEVNIPKPMNYEDHSQNLSIHFKAGTQVLTGQHLEEYVRFRHDELGDIGRVQRQQAVLKDLFRTFTQPATLAHLPQVFDVIQRNVDTDLSVGEMLGLAAAIAQIDRQHMNLVMLPGRFSRSDEYSRSYWIPDIDALDHLLTRYFDRSGAAPAADASRIPGAGQLKIAVANATTQSKLGQKAVVFLQQQGFRNVYLTDHELDLSGESSAQTQIIAEQGNPDAASTVQHAVGLGHIQVASTGDLYSDVTVVVGNDWSQQLNHIAQ